jgi:hypothetical protein
VTVAAVWIAVANQHYEDAVGAVAYLAFPVVGGLVAWRIPRNAIGWIFLANGLFSTVDVLSRNFADRVVAEHRTGPLAHLCAWVDGWLWVPGIALLLVYGLLLFPTGRPPSPRWHWVVPVSAVASIGWIVSAGVVTWPKSTAALVSNQVPTTSGPAKTLFVVGVGCVLVVLGCALASAVSLLGRLVVAGGVERAQVKWVAAAGAIAVLIEALTPVLPQIQTLGESVGFALIAVAAGVAIMRYRLYDIDRIISRTVSYAVVTGLLVGVYLGCVALLTDLLPFGGTVGTAASVLVAVALFAPLRRRVQHVVDHRFNRARYDAEATVIAFAGRLRDNVELDSVRADLLAVVHRTVEPTHATLWLRSTP